MFLKIMLEKINLLQKMANNQEKQGFLSKRNDIFCNFCPTKRQFFTRPEKKIDTRKSRKGISRNAKNQ